MPLTSICLVRDTVLYTNELDAIGIGGDSYAIFDVDSGVSTPDLDTFEVNMLIPGSGGFSSNASGTSVQTGTSADKNW